MLLWFLVRWVPVKSAEIDSLDGISDGLAGLFALADKLSYTEKREGKEAAMNPITTEVLITGDHKLNLNINLPEDCPTGKALVTVTIEPEKTKVPVNRAAEVFGLGKGQVWMSDDFDGPLEDFAEYM
jgi:hypothetical protein